MGALVATVSHPPPRSGLPRPVPRTWRACGGAGAGRASSGAMLWSPADCLNGVKLALLGKARKRRQAGVRHFQRTTQATAVVGQTTCPVLLVKPRAVNKTVYNQKDTFRRGFVVRKQQTRTTGVCKQVTGKTGYIVIANGTSRRQSPRVYYYTAGTRTYEVVCGVWCVCVCVGRVG